MKPELEKHGLAAIKLLIVLMAMAILYFCVIYFLPVLLNVSGFLAVSLLPFILAVVIAILIDPVVDWLETKRRMPRGAAVALTLCLLLLFIVFALVLIISQLMEELSGLYVGLPAYSRDLLNYGLHLFEQAREFFSNNPLPLEAQSALQNNLQRGLTLLSEGVSASINLLFNLLTGLPGFVTIIIIAGLATFFISRDKTAISFLLFSLMPKKLIKPTSAVISDISRALVGFFRAQTILISITAISCIIGLNILGAKYAFTVGILVGLFDLLPILGPGAILVPWAIIEILIGELAFGVKVLVLYALLTGVRQLIEPKILASNIGLHPLATLMALYLGLRFFGVTGIILGPFLIIIVKSLLKSTVKK